MWSIVVNVNVYIVVKVVQRSKVAIEDVTGDKRVVVNTGYY